MTSFRINDAFRKWESASLGILTLHARARGIITRVCAHCKQPITPKLEEQLSELRRLLVCACVLIKKHVRDEKNLEYEVERGLLTAEEQHDLTKHIATIADMPGGDLKRDKFPSKNRPAYCFYKMNKIAVDLFREGHIASAPHAAGIENAMLAMSDVYEDLEFLSSTLLPLPYAQLSRVIFLWFVILVPLVFLPAIGWGVVGLSFFVNFLYFSIDEVATQLEQPFGDDPSDVDLEKLCRQIDKHCAAQLSLFLRKPVSNFDLFPESRSSDVAGNALRRNDTLSMSERSLRAASPPKKKSRIGFLLRKSEAQRQLDVEASASRCSIVSIAVHAQMATCEHQMFASVQEDPIAESGLGSFISEPVLAATQSEPIPRVLATRILFKEPPELKHRA